MNGAYKFSDVHVDQVHIWIYTFYVLTSLPITPYLYTRRKCDWRLFVLRLHHDSTTTGINPALVPVDPVNEVTPVLERGYAVVNETYMELHFEHPHAWFYDAVMWMWSITCVGYEC